jgi:hypothetical protein
MIVTTHAVAQHANNAPPVADYRRHPPRRFVSSSSAAPNAPPNWWKRRGWGLSIKERESERFHKRKRVERAIFNLCSILIQLLVYSTARQHLNQRSSYIGRNCALWIALNLISTGFAISAYPATQTYKITGPGKLQPWFEVMLANVGTFGNMTTHT